MKTLVFTCMLCGQTSLEVPQHELCRSIYVGRMSLTDLAERVKATRNLLGISLQVAAEQMYMTKPQVHYLEHARWMPTPDEWANIMRWLTLSVDDGEAVASESND